MIEMGLERRIDDVQKENDELATRVIDLEQELRRKEREVELLQRQLREKVST